MKKANIPIFLYPFWGKYAGLLIILFGFVVFFYRIIQYDIFDLTGVSFPVAIGLMMVFFTKEKDFDERVAYLKFKSLATAVPVAAIITMLVNYIENFSNYSIETDFWFSISAFEYLSIVLVIALGWFHFLKLKE